MAPSKGFVIHIILNRTQLGEWFIINSTLWHCRD